MQIREGAYYRTRGGDVVGPMQPSKREKLGGWIGIDHSWYEDGRFLDSGAQHILDLISEVYVSDTPPAVQETEAEWRARLLAAGPGPLIEVHDRKTLRDEFASDWMKGVLANPNNADGDMESFSRMAYRMADAMMEAREK